MKSSLLTIARSLSIARKPLGIILGAAAVAASLLTLVGRSISDEAMEVAREQTENPAARAAWEERQLQDRNGQVPAGALMKAYEQRNAMTYDPAAWSEFPAANSIARSPGRRIAGIESSIWSWRGPNNIAGRITALVIHPTNPSTMWASAASGGVWKTTNGGATWTPTSDFIDNLSIACLAIDPTNPAVLYAGVGDAGPGGAEGVFKSVDGGATWTRINSTLQSIHRLTVSPTNNRMILAGNFYGIALSTNAGTSWVQLDTVQSSISNITFNPVDSSKAVASGWQGAWYSTDGGWTWAIATGLPVPQGRIEVAYARSNPTTVYASVDYNNGRQMYRSNDGGRTYVFTGTTGDIGYTGYCHVLWVDPTNANVLVDGGVNLWRSTDGGAHFTKIGDGFGDTELPHADHHAIVSHPNYDGTTNRVVFFGTDGGVYKANDILSASISSGFTNLNHGLGITQMYDASVNATGTLFAATQDNGALRQQPTDASGQWTTRTGGDITAAVSDLVDQNYVYVSIPTLQVLRSSDGGASFDYGLEQITGQYWSYPRFVWKNDPYRIPDAQNGRGNWSSPVVLDPNNDNRLLVGGLSLWRTNDVKTPNTSTTGPSWAAIKPAIDQSDDSYISAVAIAPGNSDVIWVGHNSGAVYFTSNGTAPSPTWTQVNLNPPGLPTGYCESITIDPRHPGRVYVTYGGYIPEPVWRTDNNGATWRSISNKLPEIPVRTLAISPSDSERVYIGTDVGIFASAEGGANWSPANDGPANAQIRKLFWIGTKLVAASYGRGLFTAQTQCTTVPPDLAGWWPGDDTADDIATTQDAMLVNGATFGAGHVNDGFQLGGAGDYVDIGNVSLGTAFTAASWINLADLASAPRWISNRDGAGHGIELSISPSGAVTAWVGSPTGQGYTSYSTVSSVINPGLWQHLAVTYDAAAAAGQRLKIFVNGAAAGTFTSADIGAGPGSSGSTTKVGASADGSTNFFKGGIDELQLFTRALTAAEVQGLFDGDQVGQCKPQSVVTATAAQAGATVTGGGTYQYGATVTLAATPDSCHSFLNWTENGVVVSTSTSYQFVASGNRDLVANFNSSNYTVTATAGPGGTVSGGGTYDCGSLVRLTAAPDAGTSFNRWTENGVTVSTSPTYTFTVTANRSLQANFGSPLPTAATPRISPTTGSFKKKVTVTMSSATAGATIHYTTDGSEPSSSSAIYPAAAGKKKKAKGITITGTGAHTIKAMAVAPGYNDSAVARADLTIK